MQEKIEKMFGTSKKNNKNETANSLQRFCDLRRHPTSRFKHLRLILDAMSEASGERKIFIEQHSFETFHLFHELLCQVDIFSQQHPGPRMAAHELECAFWLLDAIFCYLPELIAQKWQYAAVATSMKQFLHPHNFLGVRRLSVRLFLLWYQIMGVGPHGAHELDIYFSCLVPFLNIESNGGGKTTDKCLLELCEATYTKNIYATSTAGVTQQTTYLTKKCTPFAHGGSTAVDKTTKGALAQSYMEKMLEYISSDCTKIQWSGDRTNTQKRCLRFLTEKLHRYYVSNCIGQTSLNFDVFRPKFVANVNAAQVFSQQIVNSTNFMDDPSLACRHALIRWVAVYAFSHKRTSDSLNPSDNSFGGNGKNSILPTSPGRTPDTKLPPNFEFIRENLFGSKTMVNFVFAMLREGLLLPVSYASTMGRVFKTVREWLMLDEQPPFFNEPTNLLSNAEPYAGLQATYTSLISVLASFFNNPHLCREEGREQLVVLISTKVLALFKYAACNSCCQLSPETWQYLLKSLLDILDKILPRSPPQNQPLVTRLSGHLFETLLIVWVYAGLYGNIGTEMWEELLEILTSRTSWPELIAEWGKVVESVTRALGIVVYGVDMFDLPLERLSEQKLIRRQGASRHQQQQQQPQPQNVPNRHSKINYAGDVSLPPPKPAHDFIQGSPISANGSHALSVAVTPEGLSPASARPKSIMQAFASPAVQQANGNGPSDHQNSFMEKNQHVQISSPEETSLDGSNSLDGQNSAGDAAKESSIFDNEPTTSTTGEDGDDSVSEEFTMTEELRANAAVSDLSNVIDEEPVVSACGPSTVYVVWTRILGCLGDLNQIQNADLHLICMRTLEKLVENLLKLKENQNVIDQQQVQVQQKIVVTPPSIVPPQTVAVSWLLNALNLSERYHESKLTAVRLLCRSMVARNQYSQDVDRALLAQFFSMLHEYLLSGVEEIIGAIIFECGTTIFSSWADADSATLLLCDFVRGAASLLGSDASPKADRSTTTRFLSTVVCLPNSLATNCPCIGSDGQMKSVQVAIIRNEIVHLMQQLARSNVERDVKIEAVKGVGFHLCDLLARTRSSADDEPSMEGCYKLIFDLLPNAGPDIGLLICHVLQTVRDLRPVQTKRAYGLTFRVILALTSALETALRELSISKTSNLCEQYVTRMSLDFVDWCAEMPTDKVDGKNPDSVAFIEAMEKLIALCYTYLDETAQPVCRSTARLLLTFLCSRFDGRNLISEKSIFAMKKFDFEKKEHQEKSSNLMLGLGRQTILCAQQHPKSTTLTARNANGCRKWEALRLRAADDPPMGLADRKRNLEKWLSVEQNSKKEIETKNLKKESNAQIKNEDDLLDKLMRNLNDSSPECFSNVSIFEPSQTAGNSFSASSHVANEETVANAINQLQLNAKKSFNNVHSPSISRENRWVSPFSACKFLLGSGDFLNWDFVHGRELYALEQTERSQRELKHLDGLLLAETHKIAVIYVADGQEDKNSILSNSRGSKAFEDFVAALGWTVDLKNHRGYAGGLSADAHQTTTFYGTATTETVFHVSTRLPNDDPMKKLRHLGNDEVHIVWSEHWRDYRRSIIATDFCDVLIVIYPLDKLNMYRIRIEKREEIGDFGPLTDGMLVAWPVLAALVRCTAVNASRAKRACITGYENFYQHRFENLQNAAEHLRCRTSYSNLLSTFLKTGDGGGEWAKDNASQAHKTLTRSA